MFHLTVFKKLRSCYTKTSEISHHVNCSSIIVDQSVHVNSIEALNNYQVVVTRQLLISIYIVCELWYNIFSILPDDK